MISISFLLHPSRKDNLPLIYEAYKDYKLVDEVLIVTGTNVDTTGFGNNKFKFVHMPGPYAYGSWPSFGLTCRYTFSLSCKNRFVFVQDDDFIYYENTIQKLYEMKEPIAGLHKRWFYNEIYTKRPPSKGLKTAPIILTGGTMVDTWLLPDVIKYAKQFWGEQYQNVFNGEDIFMSRAISKITNTNEFPFLRDSIIELSTHNVQLHNKVNKEGSRVEMCKKIYDFFENS